MIGQFTLEKREGERMIIGQVNNEKLGKETLDMTEREC